MHQMQRPFPLDILLTPRHPRHPPPRLPLPTVQTRQIEHARARAPQRQELVFGHAALVRAARARIVALVLRPGVVPARRREDARAAQLDPPRRAVVRVRARVERRQRFALAPASERERHEHGAGKGQLAVGVWGCGVRGEGEGDGAVVAGARGRGVG